MMIVSAIKCLCYEYAAVRVREDRLSTPTNGWWVIIDRTGRPLSSREFLWVGDMVAGVFPVCYESEKDGKEVWSLLCASTGEFYIEEEYDSVPDICNGVARVSVAGKGYTYIDVTGVMGWDGWRKEREYFKSAGRFLDDVGVVQLANGKYTYITRGFDGGAVSFFRQTNKVYQFAGVFHDGMSVVVYRKGKHGSYGYVTLRGLTPLLGGDGKPLSFSHANVFMCGWGLVKDKKGLFNYIDKRGRFISERWFEAAGPFYECRMGENLKMAVAHVKYNLDSGWTLIDGHGAECFDVQRFMCNYDDDTGVGTVGHKK